MVWVCVGEEEEEREEGENRERGKGGGGLKGRGGRGGDGEGARRDVAGGRWRRFVGTMLCIYTPVVIASTLWNGQDG